MAKTIKSKFIKQAHKAWKIYFDKILPNTCEGCFLSGQYEKFKEGWIEGYIVASKAPLNNGDE